MSTPSKQQVGPEVDHELLALAQAQWCPGAKLHNIRTLNGGYSGASVLLVDLERKEQNSALAAGELRGGFYVVKLDKFRRHDAPNVDEACRHKDASEWSPKFTEAHLPHLERSFRSRDRLALLYHVAGHSLERLIGSDLLSVGSLEAGVRALAFKLLVEFNRKATVKHNVTLAEVFHEWLDWHLDPKSDSRLFNLAESLSGKKRAFVRASRILANPLELAVGAMRDHQLPVVFNGMLHGDLHRENILWEQVSPNDHFWLIDFAFSQQGPLLFDHAYLELSLLLQKFKHVDQARLLNLLDCLLHPLDQLGSKFVSQEDYGILTITRALRDGISDWQKTEQELRADAVHQQWCLARVAAGLNWSCMPVSNQLQQLAFAYAGHAAKEYLECFHSKDWQSWSADGDTVGAPPESAAAGSAPVEDGWRELWKEMSGFSPKDAAFVLVAGPLGASDKLSSIGLLPWSIVIDLDAESDIIGLLGRARQNVQQHRALHVFGRVITNVSYSRGTAWMMAAGSTTLSEPQPTSMAEWRRLYKGGIRQLATELRSAIAPIPVRILVIPGESDCGDRIQRTLEEIVDELGTDRRVIVASDKDVARWKSSDADRVLHVSAVQLAEKIGTIFGFSSENQAASVPGVNGPVELDAEKVRNFEEDFEILHSGILVSRPYEDDEDAFWHGGPPSWRDLESEIPVRRPDIEHRISAELRTKLRENRARKVELFHTPGSGGTTTSLMVAWALRKQFPTVVLRRNSRNTADRVGWLFQLTGLPILLVGDSSVISRTESEELLRQLANSNTRAVVLHIVRIPKKMEGGLGIFDPMEIKEAELFRAAFAVRTADPKTKVLLGQIAREERRELEALRSPFFFGLITFEEHFTHLRDYVTVHLAVLGFAGRKLLSYLSLVARYSQSTFSSALMRKLVNLEPEGRRHIAEVIGIEAARLVVEWGGQAKLVHPLVAEEVLRQLGGDNWKYGLPDLCADFIQDMIRAAGGHTHETQQLFFHLFIERDEWSDDDSGIQRERFSPLIESIGNEAGQRRVLKLLTDSCPDEPHYWNHLGRHSVYSTSPNYSEAESFLTKAIALSNGRDPLHHHALGLVRRFWIRQRIRDLLAKPEHKRNKPSPQLILDEISSLADGAFAEFAQCRKIQPEVAHGYVTQVQTILFIADSLTQASSDGIASLTEQRNAVGDWLRKNVAIAEELMARLAQLRGPDPETSYEINCLTKLAKLYGKFEIIDVWESMLGRTSEPLHLRRALASLYLARRGRRWSSLSVTELRRIARLTEDNLRMDPADDRDLRLWFHAIRRLPEFNYYEAIDRLQAWASRTDSVDAHYYLYILYYLRWQGKGEDAEKAVKEHIDASTQRRIGIRGYSYEWLGYEPEMCPLVHASELGAMDRQKGFFTDVHRLAFTTGTIESIRPQAGMIRLGQVLRAFFVPPPDIRETSHLNATVHFHLGFSYEGFRAWNVRLGPAPGRPAPAAPVKLWIGGIPYRFIEDDIRSLFQPYGRVDRVEMLRDPVSNTNKGFAFVIMASKDDAPSAIHGLTGRKMEGGRLLQVREATSEKG